jgi:two-component sensor histidine kinase
MALWKSTHSIQGRLAGFAATVFLPGILALGAILSLNILEARRAQETALLAAARAVSAAVDLELATFAATSEALAESDAAAAADWDRLGRRVERAELGTGVAAFVRDLSRARRVGRAGPAEGSTAPGLDTAALAKAPRRVSSSGRTTITGLVESGQGPPAVVVEAPVPSRGDALSVALWVDPQTLLSTLPSWGLPEGTMVTLVDTDRKVLARSRHPERFVGRSATPQMIAAMDAGPEGVTSSRSLEGQATVVAFHQSKLSGWTAMVVVPRSYILSPVWINGLVLALLLLVLGAASLWAARNQIRALSADIRALEEDAHSIAAGRLVARNAVRVDNLDRIQAALSAASIELLRRQDRQTLLIHELNHRVKNTLATIQSLAAQTFRDADGDLRAKFEQRLGALAAAHDLLTQTTWSAVDIRQVAARCGGASGHDQVLSDGPSVLLQPEAALALCMCLHELTTNSLKYGALTRLDGRIDLTWRIEGEELVLTWREEGGPPVTAPERTGFGSRLIDRLVKHELNGRVDRQYDAAGLVVVGRFRLSARGRWTTEFD